MDVVHFEARDFYRWLGVFRRVGVEPTICDATDEYNRRHAEAMARMLLQQGLPIYTFSDVAFKPGCKADIIEESQPLEVAKLVAKAGKRVVIRDRAAIVEMEKRKASVVVGSNNSSSSSTHARVLPISIPLDVAAAPA